MYQHTYAPTHYSVACNDTMCKGISSLSNACLERAKELKARLVTFLQKPDWSFASWKVGKNGPTPEECLKWRDSFEKLLSNKHGLRAFTAFLVSEFSEENIAFYFACEDFKNTKSASELAAKAQRIYDEFIGADAPREINIDHEACDTTKDNLKALTSSCFDLAQYRIYMLMTKDCYPRFLRSPAYRELTSQPSTRGSKLPRQGNKA
ncbi:regulator of G-protein signaling 16 [Aplochiton taeniatus]